MKKKRKTDQIDRKKDETIKRMNKENEEREER